MFIVSQNEYDTAVKIRITQVGRSDQKLTLQGFHRRLRFEFELETRRLQLYRPHRAEDITYSNFSPRSQSASSSI